MAFPDNVSIVKEFKYEDAPVSISNENIEIFGAVYPYIFEANPSASKSRQVKVSGRNLVARLYISTNQNSASKVCAVIKVLCKFLCICFNYLNKKSAII